METSDPDEVEIGEVVQGSVIGDNDGELVETIKLKLS